ncbi:MAG: AIR synthase-related protein [Chthoniobacteraceae bacterium]
MVGLIAEEKHITTSHFKETGDTVILIGGLGSELGASHYLKVVHGKKAGIVPRLDFAREIAMQKALLALIQAGLVKSAHDCSEGGLAVALAESTISGDAFIGAEIDLGDTPLRLDQLLFNESQGRVVISTAAENAGAVLASLSTAGVPAQVIGKTIAEELQISANGAKISWPVAQLHETWYCFHLSLHD